MAWRDRIAAAALLLVAGAAIRESARLPFGAVRNPGPGFLPWWAGLTLAGLALVLLTQALLARRAPGAEGPPDEGTRGKWTRVAGLLGALALYVVGLEPLGYPICTFLLVLLMLGPTRRAAIMPALALAAIAAGGSYLLFAAWLRVPLPPGPFPR